MPSPRFLRFCLIGTLGFFVDASVLMLLILGFGLGPYSARFLSFLAAATTTWALNRRYTFETRRFGHGGVEWAAYLLLVALGGALNYASYAALVWASPRVRDWPVLGVAVGSLVGLSANWISSRHCVFAAPRARRHADER